MRIIQLPAGGLLDVRTIQLLAGGPLNVRMIGLGAFRHIHTLGRVHSSGYPTEPREPTALGSS